MRRSRVLWLVVGLAVVATGVFLVVGHDHSTMPRAEYCSAQAGETYVEVDLDQARYASLIAAIGTRRNLPARASSIAIAAAFQESKLHNIPYGDRDSLGLFQQRPSQGWGSRKQIMNPRYAIGRFFTSLVKVEGYRRMDITEAAQKVQRSAFGDAYAQHEPYARALASALTGYSPAAFSCQIRTPEPGTPRRLRREVRKAFGPMTQTSTEHTVRYPVPGRRKGWALAHYAVANAKRLGVTAVTYDGHRWTAEHSPQGWVRRDDAGASVVRIGLG